MGVGAAIAAGSQAEKGIWALFVKAAVTSIKQVVGFILQRLVVSQCWEIREAKDNNKRASPRRLVKAVIIPAPKDLGFK